MTPEQIALGRQARELPAGDAIEDAIDTLYDLSHIRDKRGRRKYRHSRNTDDALMLLTMTDHHCTLTVHMAAVGGLSQECRVTIEDNQQRWHSEGEGETIALAICRAVLQIAEDTP